MSLWITIHKGLDPANDLHVHTPHFKHTLAKCAVRVHKTYKPGALANCYTRTNTNSPSYMYMQMYVTSYIPVTWVERTLTPVQRHSQEWVGTVVWLVEWGESVCLAHSLRECEDVSLKRDHLHPLRHHTTQHEFNFCIYTPGVPNEGRKGMGGGARSTHTTHLTTRIY